MFRKISFVFILFAINISITIGDEKQASHPGKIIYDNNCLTCHQADGSGVPGLNPPLSKVSWVTGDKTRLIKIVLNGMNTPIEIDGEMYHNPMPSHQHLTDKEIADVLTYIRSNFGNKASAVSAEEVKKIRAKK